MNESEKPAKSVFETVEGLTPVDPDMVKDLQQATEEVIPEIVKVIEERRLLAAHTRHLQLKS